MSLLGTLDISRIYIKGSLDAVFLDIRGSLDALSGIIPPIIFDLMAYEPDNWLDAQYKQRIPRTINAAMVPSPQSDFPLTINNTFTELIGFLEVELRFASTDDIPLDYEIEKFDTLTGELIVWFKKSTVDNGDIIYIYFDNPSAVDEQNSAAVWSNNFVNVQHLNQQSGNILDSTKFHNDGVPLGSPINALGQIGDAKENTTINDGYNTNPNVSLNTTDITVSAWIKPSLVSLNTIVSKAENPIDVDWIFVLVAGLLTVIISNNPNISAGSISINTTTHVAFTIVGGTTLNMYIDGVLSHTQAIIAKNTSSISSLQIASLGSSSGLIGIYDEVHISNDGKSADWIKTEYNNQKDDDAFYTTGAVELVPTVFDIMGYEPDDWLDNRFQFRISVTIKAGQVPSSQNDFPILIDNIFSDLQFISTTDFLFSSNDNIPLEYDIEKFDTLTGELVAWVKIPAVSDDDIIYIYYNPNVVIEEDTQNPPAVWSNNFIDVQHMAQTSGNILDSTKFHNDGIPIGTPLNATMIANAKNLDDNDDAYFTLANDSLNTSDITVSTQVNLNNLGVFMIIASKWFNPSDEDWLITTLFGEINILLSSEDPIETGIFLSAGVRYHVAFTIVGGTTLNLYLDGELVYTQTIIPKITSSTSRLEIGNDGGSSLQGIIDEVHISNDGKSADWIKTEYNNQKDFDTFFTLGVKEEAPTVFDTMGYEEA